MRSLNVGCERCDRRASTCGVASRCAAPWISVCEPTALWSAVHATQKTAELESSTLFRIFSRFQFMPADFMFDYANVCWKQVQPYFCELFFLCDRYAVWDNNAPMKFSPNFISILRYLIGGHLLMARSRLVTLVSSRSRIDLLKMMQILLIILYHIIIIA